MLKRQKVIDVWHDRRILPGEHIGNAIDQQINSDEIILLLVSPDFIASDYCYEIEMRRALERHDSGEATVIPVILRPCDWHQAPFGQLLAVPRDGKPVTQWPNQDEAFLQVAMAVREVAAKWKGSKPVPTAAVRTSVPAGGSLGFTTSATSKPRSSNLRLAKTFTQREKDQYLLDTFEYIAKYFENSLNELANRNSGYEGIFRKVDTTRFFATVYRSGSDVARATIFTGGDAFGRGINYVQGETMGTGSINESLSVQADDQMLYFTSLGMSSLGQERDQKLSQEGAADALWSQFIAPLQQDRHR